MEWNEIEIGAFLKERTDRIKPEDANQLPLKRIEKIDFTGKIHLADKAVTQTNMILVKPGDLVISGINVEKGAVGVYEGREDVLATIHYSSYEFDRGLIDIEFLKWFLTSNVFTKVLKEQTGGGIKTELKPKKFLSLKVRVPTLRIQRELAERINAVSSEIKVIIAVTTDTESQVVNLRQAILQEAIQGKLVPQDMQDEPASVILEKVKSKKEQLIRERKIKKEKPLPPILEEEIPYELPQGWEWVRLGEITQFVGGYAFKSDSYVDNSENQIIRLGNVKNNKLLLNSKPAYIPDKVAAENESYRIKENDILVTMTGTRGKRDYFYTCLIDKTIANKKLYLNQRVGCLRCSEYLNVELINLFLKSNLILDMIFETETGTANQGNIGSTSIASKIIFPLPPLNEQKRIVESVEKLMVLCDQLMEKVELSKQDSEILLRSVLQEEFSV